MHKVHEILFSPINDFDREAFILNYSFLNSTDRKYLKSKILSDKLSPIFLEYLTKNNLLGFIDKKELEQIASQAQRFQIQNLQIVREVVHLSRLFRKENIEEKVKLNHAIFGNKDMSLEIQDLWEGERVSAKNNLPIASKIPGAKNIYCIGGLGSRGLSYAPFLAEIVSSAIQDKQIPLGKEIFTLLNI